MIVSEARIAANRRNAARSTGPRTAEGKERSRANALKHGLCSTVVLAEDAAQVQGRTADFFTTLKPQNDFHGWLVTEIALLSLRIDRCERIERRVRDKIAIRAELSWEDDRRLDATLLGGQLGSRPDVVVEQLRKTPQGCEWLMARWAMLAHAADVKGAWTSEQTHLAYDLLATPAEFRTGHAPGVMLDVDGRLVDDVVDPASVARREIATLKGRRDLVEGLDQASRALAEADLGEDTDPELRRLRRYESTLHGRLRWCLRQLHHQSPLREPGRELMATWLGQRESPPEAELPASPPLPGPTSEPMPEPPAPPRSSHPPIDLEPEEVPSMGEPVNIPMVLAGRRRKRFDKVQARRETRRRKLKLLRA